MKIALIVNGYAPHKNRAYVIHEKSGSAVLVPCPGVTTVQEFRRTVFRNRPPSIVVEYVENGRIMRGVAPSRQLALTLARQRRARIIRTFLSG